nr:AAA family ATPase [uncultured Dysosmobacter sp.]
MRIQTLRLENFQGIKSATFDFQGKSASIYGDNATGKTTVYNALTWLLFDRPSTGAKNFTPKTKGPTGDLHNLDHAAEARFIMDDGRLVTLRKVFHEVWKKKRGAATEEFDGHSVDFFIDGVPTKEREYTASLLAFCGGAEKMKMLTMPQYFPEDMAWDARRKILLEVCGDVTDDDVIATDPALEELGAYLLMPGTTGQFYTVDEYKKIAAAKKADINKQLQGIPGRIDEAQRAIPDAGTTEVQALADLDQLADERERLTAEKAAILAGDTATADARTKTAQAEAALAKARADYATKAAAANADVNAKISDLQLKLAEARRRKLDDEMEAERQTGLAERMATRRAELLQLYKDVQAETWDEGQEVCPTCHQPLPPEQVEQMRSDFNLAKSKRLQAINEQGMKEASKGAIEEARRKAAILQGTADQAADEIKRLTIELGEQQTALVNAPTFETTDDYTELTAAVAACRAAERQAGQNTDEAVAAVKSRLEAVYAATREAEAALTKVRQAETQRKRIQELEAQEKALSAQYEELEKGLYLCDLFTKAKVALLTDRINGKFKSVRFRLFVEQQNGGVKDDCEVLVPDTTGRLVPYPFANNAARINAGLEIIDALAAHWHISMPVFIDNAESVTHLAQTDMQTVRLVVSEEDTSLRLELDEQREEGAA